jgi:hypothetical protein
MDSRRFLGVGIVLSVVTTLAFSGCGGGGGKAQPDTGSTGVEDAMEEEAGAGDEEVLSGEDPGAQPPDEGSQQDPGNPLEDPGPAYDPGQPPDLVGPEDPGTPYDPGTPTDPGAPKDPGTPTDPGVKPDPGTTTATQDVGEPCTADSQCKGGDKAACIPDKFSDGSEGWPDGYCTIFECQAGSCPAGSECYETKDTSGNTLTLCLATCQTGTDCNKGYACPAYGACVPGCTTSADCEADEVCGSDGLCAAKPCTAGSCGAGMVCENGTCVPDISGGPGPGPGPDCPNLPPKDCTGSASYCGELLPFEPLTGPGYDNYPLNGECYACSSGKKCDGYGTCKTTGKLESQWRSYLRRDAQMLVKYATAMVECKAKGWGGGNGAPLGLGDMSEKSGAIPGKSVSSPGHPEGTHTNGFDIDIGYYLNSGTDNHLKPICEHTLNGQEQYHCVKPPTILDLWRTTLFIGTLLTSSNTRVIGVDGQVGLLIEKAMPTLCANGWLPKTACNKLGSGLAFEVTNQNWGWYYFHHHHLHLSTLGTGYGSLTDGMPCITRDCFQGAGAANPAWDAYRTLLPRVRVRIPTGL